MLRRALQLALTAALLAALLPAAALAQEGGEPHFCRRVPPQAQRRGPCSRLQQEPAPADSRVVVAPIDSGINPYHEAFRVERSAVTPAVLAEFGITADRVLQISDSYEADVAAGVYDGVQEGVAYHFAGTNIIVRSAAFGSRPFLPDDEGDTHGTGVAGSVVAANPEAILYFLEGIGADSEVEAFTHPAVDIVTTSYGFATALPVGGIAGSYEGVVERGKLHFGANPNDPSPAPLDSTGGPWWSISISGFEEGSSGGKTVVSGSLPEFVADFTQDLPYCATCTTGTEQVGGTSFATPTSAGLMSAAILELRRRAGHVGGIADVDGVPHLVAGGGLQLTGWDLRRALEEAAAIPELGEWDPAAAIADLGTYPNLPIGGYAIYGWGLLTADPARSTVAGILDVVETGETTKPADTCAFMTLHHQLRVAAWTANPSSEGLGGDASAYLPC